MRAGPRLWVTALLILLLGVILPPFTPAEGKHVAASLLPVLRSEAPFPAPPRQDRTTQRLLEQINHVRWDHGHIPPLKWNSALASAALAHSQSMAKNNFFGHKGYDSSSPWNRIDAAGYGNWYLLAENIAAGYTTPEDVVQAWMESPLHRGNLLNAELQEAGIGYFWEPEDDYPGGQWGYEHYWTLDMGARWDAYPLVIAGESYSTTTRQVPLYFYGQGWATEMRLSNDGVHWPEWQPYQPSLTWELSSGNGVKQVYGQLRDGQGRLMSAQDEIVLEEKNVPPETPPLVSPAQAFFVVRAGEPIGQPGQYPLRIAGRGLWPAIWWASWDQDWLQLDRAVGIAPTEVVLTLTEEAGLLAQGAYTATLSLRTREERVEVPVRLFVFPKVYAVYLPHLDRR